MGLVLQSATLGIGGEIFMLDMGEPMKIVDLARQLIELSGLEPEWDIEIKFTGLRPGEKLFEELSHTLENTTATEHAKIMRLRCDPQSLDCIETQLASLLETTLTGDLHQFKSAITSLVPEYQPYLQ